MSLANRDQAWGTRSTHQVLIRLIAGRRCFPVLPWCPGEFQTQPAFQPVFGGT